MYYHYITIYIPRYPRPTAEIFIIIKEKEEIIDWFNAHKYYKLEKKSTLGPKHYMYNAMALVHLLNSKIKSFNKNCIVFPWLSKNITLTSQVTSFFP